MTKRSQDNARRFIHAALRGTPRQQDAIESEFGAPLCMLLDDAWFEADLAGLRFLAQQCESAYRRLTE